MHTHSFIYIYVFNDTVCILFDLSQYPVCILKDGKAGSLCNQKGVYQLIDPVTSLSSLGRYHYRFLAENSIMIYFRLEFAQIHTDHLCWIIMSQTKSKIIRGSVNLSELSKSFMLIEQTNMLLKQYKLAKRKRHSISLAQEKYQHSTSNEMSLLHGNQWETLSHYNVSKKSKLSCFVTQKPKMKTTRKKVTSALCRYKEDFSLAYVSPLRR